MTQKQKTVLIKQHVINTVSLHSYRSFKRVTGIEPASSAWEAGILPLNYTRILQKSVYASFFSYSSIYLFLFYLVICSKIKATNELLEKIL